MSLPNAFPSFMGNQIKHNVHVSDRMQQIATRAGTNGVWMYIVLDESGSMTSCREQTIKSYNSYMYEQKNSNIGMAWISLLKFDSPKLDRVYDRMPITETALLNNDNYRPGGGTNLLDAVGHCITNIDVELSKLKQDERPGVFVVILTDGEENSSREFTREHVQSLIKERQTLDWSFVFLGANQDAWANAKDYGISAANAMSYSTSNMGGTFSALSQATGRYRTSMTSGTTGATLNSAGLFNDEERDQRA